MSSGKKRLDVALAHRGLIASRSQAENYIKLGKVKVNGKILNKSSILVSDDDTLEIRGEELYVSRAGLKLESVAKKLGLDFRGKTVLDVGSSTGGFTDYALKHGAAKVIAVDVGTDQLHPSLRSNDRIELHEKTDIRDFEMDRKPDIVLIDVSFISLRQVLPAVLKLAGKNTQLIAMLKPQFESSPREVNKGVIKNDSIRRQILRDFENWVKTYFVISDKADSEVAGAKGNRERFYSLRKRPVDF
ncbi:MAG TPA: TlyA family RNA methyltransferase [Candidatus Saccharimonadales bacterium]|nr:TlyA family RNA methyltransferase [Candidatus Saccharimonadales bacterium]